MTPAAQTRPERIINLGASVYSIEDEQGRLGQVRRNFGGSWTAYRENENGYLGPIGNPYDHLSRKQAIVHLRKNVRHD